jgi:uncharacterized repeat protein (TIGR03803 family)
MRKTPSTLKVSILSCALALAASPGAAQARGSFKLIHSFAGGGSDGAGPFGGVTPAGQGGFYVATDGGGSSNRGTLTLIHKDGTSQVLHAFAGGSDGQNADGAPVVWSVDGNVYGTTQFGGTDGCGSAYRYLPASGVYQQLAAFHCAPDAAFPFAGLASSGFYGVLFGISYNGGSYDNGELFDIYPDGSVRTDCAIGQNVGTHPFAAVTPSGDSLYIETTSGGANNVGALTLLEPSCNGEVLHDFGSDGAAPYGTLLEYNNLLYGTTSSGGAGTNLGTVFSIGLEGGGYTVLHVFQGICCGSDGSFPRSGLTLNKKDGMLYGTTINGGNSSDSGTVYKIDPNTGAESIVYSFSGNDGAHPYGNLYIKGKTIYGTTAQGGANNLGVVFELKS